MTKVRDTRLINVDKLKKILEVTAITDPIDADQFVDKIPDDCFAGYSDIVSYLENTDTPISVETLMRAVDIHERIVEEQEQVLHICPTDDPRYYFRKVNGGPEDSRQELVSLNDIVDATQSNSEDVECYIYSLSELERAPQEVKDHAMVLDDVVDCWSELYAHTEFDLTWFPAGTKIENYILFSKELSSVWWTFEIEKENGVAYYFIDNVGGPFATGEETRNPEARFLSGSIPMDMEDSKFLVEVARQLVDTLSREGSQ